MPYFPLRVLSLSLGIGLICIGSAQAQQFSQWSPYYLKPAPPLEVTPDAAALQTTAPPLRSTVPQGLHRTTTIARPPDSFYQTPGNVEPWIFAVAKARPERVRLLDVGLSALKRHIWALEIRPDAKTPITRLHRLAVICRQHGNEPEATVSGTRFLAQYLTPATAKAKLLASKTALLIVPIANPDGAASYQRHDGFDIDMNRDWGRNHSPEVAALTRMIRLWKPNLLVDNHQWLPFEHMPPPMAEASGPALSKQTVRAMSYRNAQRGYNLAARSRWGLDTLCHRYWGQRFGIPAILLETRHQPTVAGARDKAIAQAITALWSAVESVAK